MKRKASDEQGGDIPPKTARDTSNESKLDSPIKDLNQTPSRSSSGRQRKAPAWLASYITDGSTAAKGSPEPSKQKLSGSAGAKNKDSKPVKNKLMTNIETNDTVEEIPALRRGSTLKLEDSPPKKGADKKPQSANSHSISLVRKDTEFLNSPGTDSFKKKIESFQDISQTFVDSVLKNSLDEFHTSLSSNHPELLLSGPENSLQLSELLQSSISLRESISDNLVNVIKSCDAKDLEVVKKIAGEANATLSPDEKKMSEVVLEKPKMLEVVICVSTSGSMGDYLAVLQEKTRDLVWQLQSLIPDLRIGVLAHTQGGIHDDKPSKSAGSPPDHNYIRIGGHSGTKWLDLGATFSQICAFVDSLEPEATVYPDYVQDNLEMALWKLQRCMSWSSCSYRTVVMIGRGRPNRTSFYLQKEHWRSWIRSALEIKHKTEIPVIDWELEAKLLAQMGIHVFTIQASSPKTVGEDDEDEGTSFFRRVADITNGLHIKLTEASKLVDILVGVCCACHGPDLLQTHRDTVRDENDGVMPPQLKDIFVSLQLHSKRRSLSTIPSLVGDLSILKSQLANTDSNGNVSSSDEEAVSADEELDNVVPERRKQDHENLSKNNLFAVSTAQTKFGAASTKSRAKKIAETVIKNAKKRNSQIVKNKVKTLNAKGTPKKAEKVLNKKVSPNNMNKKSTDIKELNKKKADKKELKKKIADKKDLNKNKINKKDLNNTKVDKKVSKVLESKVTKIKLAKKKTVLNAIVHKAKAKTDKVKAARDSQKPKKSKDKKVNSVSKIKAIKKDKKLTVKSLAKKVGVQKIGKKGKAVA